MGRDQHAARANGAAVFSWTRLGAAPVARAVDVQLGAVERQCIDCTTAGARGSEALARGACERLIVAEGGIAITKVKQLGRAKTKPRPMPLRCSALQGLSCARPARLANHAPCTPNPDIRLLSAASSTLRAHPLSFLQPHLFVGQSLFSATSCSPSTTNLIATFPLTPVIHYFAPEIVCSYRCQLRQLPSFPSLAAPASRSTCTLR